MYPGEMYNKSADFQAGFDKAFCAVLDHFDDLAESIQDSKKPIYTKKEVLELLNKTFRSCMLYRNIGYESETEDGASPLIFRVLR